MKLSNNDITFRVGNILCSIDYPIPVTYEFKAQILTLDIKAPLTIGQKLFLHCQSQKTVVKVKKIHKIFSGGVNKVNPMYFKY
jgi:translation elongation factor EF-1alpha